MREEYLNQVALLVETLPHIAKEPCFVLKGGTAINLFYRDMPRLSIDIDLAYIFFDDRAMAVSNIDAALSRIAESLASHGLTATIQGRAEKRSSSRTKGLRLRLSQTIPCVGGSSSRLCRA
jgi:predicted nucleotidyltransferase component of viral defense system